MSLFLFSLFEFSFRVLWQQPASGERDVLCSVLRSLCARTRFAALLMPSSLLHFCHSSVVVVVVVSENFFEAGIGCFLVFMYVFCRKANVGALSACYKLDVLLF